VPFFGGGPVGVAGAGAATGVEAAITGFRVADTVAVFVEVALHAASIRGGTARAARRTRVRMEAIVAY
jgi:hypothetical protein